MGDGEKQGMAYGLPSHFSGYIGCSSCACCRSRMEQYGDGLSQAKGRTNIEQHLSRRVQ